MRFLFVALVALLAPTLASAQKPKGHCSGTPPDSAEQAQGPVFRDCEVDQPAERLGGRPSINWDPPNPAYRSNVYTCLQTMVEFVVDTLGLPELESVRTISSNNSEFEQAVLASVGELRYRPARRQGEAVRQVVVYGLRARVEMLVVTTFGPGGSNGGTPMTPPPLRC